MTKKAFDKIAAELREATEIARGEAEPAKVKMPPAPIFSGSAGGPSLATIYFAHYRRLVSVLDAARTGNLDLVKIAVAHQDKFGCQDEPQPTTFTRVAPADGGGHESSVEKA